MNNDVIFEAKIEKARNILRYTISKITAEYSLPGVMIELVVESLLSDMKQGRLSFIAEKMTMESKEKDKPEDKT